MDIMSECKKNLVYFFNRPKEPCFLEKGEDDTVFRCPSHFYPDKFKECTENLGKDNTIESDLDVSPRKLKTTKKPRIVDVRDIDLPDLSQFLELPYNEHFSLFVPKHKRLAGKLIDLFLGLPNLEHLQSFCAYSQMRINPYMFNYCLSVAILHRPDTKGVDVPTLVETFPDKFISPQILREAREVSSVCTPAQRKVLTIPRNHTASDAEPEQRVAYFREDIGVNLHHWHWHLVYPFQGTAAIVNKDRRGELFYYMHQQIVARYNVERFCNGLGRARPYEDFTEPIEEGYFPKLTTTVANRTWQPRYAGTTPSDLNRPVDEVKIDVFEMGVLKERILQAIENIVVRLPDNKLMLLDEDTGIDVLGNMIEASDLSPNNYYYGNYHNTGHLFISYSHDPDHRHLEFASVMGDSATAMRDPVFYRLHTHIDELFRKYKRQLPPYPKSKLEFTGVSISRLRVESGLDKEKGDKCEEGFELRTQWEKSVVDLEWGLDFTPRGHVFTSFTHLTHDDFHYVIEVSNTNTQEVQGTVRLFLAPSHDEHGEALSFEDQRILMIELDKFTHKIPVGTSIIRRSSKDSSVTIPYERTFRAQSGRSGEKGSTQAAPFDFCGCGWPHHMLIPKGTTEGYPMVLFCMISNWAEDKVDQDLAGTCSDAASYCGIRDRKYPDRRAMGYPFDRPARVASLPDFLTPNMAVSNVVIRFKDEVRIHGQKGGVSGIEGALPSQTIVEQETILR